MSDQDATTDANPVPPSRAYRSARKKKSKVQAVEAQNEPQLPASTNQRVPMPAPPVLVRIADAEPVEQPEVEIERWQEPEIVLPDMASDFVPNPEPQPEPEAAAPTDPEPYSPFRVAPTRQLPDMVFPTPGTNQSEPTAKSGSTLTTVIRVIAFFGVVAVGVIGYGAFTKVAERNPLQGQMTSSAQIGQCYTDQVRFVDCTGSHTYEVYATNVVAERSDYPGVVSRTLGSEACELQFFGYVGLEPAEASMAIYSVYPSEEQWADGERWEICVLSEPSLKPLIGSATASID